MDNFKLTILKAKIKITYDEKELLNILKIHFRSGINKQIKKEIATLILNQSKKLNVNFLWTIKYKEILTERIPLKGWK